jgi:transcriptional regulator with XRE-family HTH domain
MNTKQRFGRNIVTMMKRRRMSSSQLSTEMAIPRRTVQHWMHGDHLPYKHGYWRLARALHTTPTALLTGGEHSGSN